MNNTLNILRPIKAFSIVSAPYVDLTGHIKTFPSGITQPGLFMVARVDDDGNVLAFKITSQRSKFINDYTYSISASSHPFLRADSYVQLDKWHTLDINSCVYIGEVKPSLRMAILRKYDLINRDIDKSLKDNMPWESLSSRYTSPNVKSYSLCRHK